MRFTLSMILLRASRALLPPARPSRAATTRAAKKGRAKAAYEPSRAALPPDARRRAPRRATRERAREKHTNKRSTTQAQPLLDKCVEDTKAESGCLYYGWTVKEDGSKRLCRETYVDGAAAGEHLSCVAASGALGEALEKGYIELDNIDVMGTEADIAAAQKVPEYAAFG
mgnify:CR=1 FL=1